MPSPFNTGDAVVFNLNTPDFTTAKKLSDAINAAMGEGAAESLDGSSIRVTAPQDPAARVALVSALENITLDPGEAAAKIIVNSRTGTVVIGQHVRVSQAAVTHGSLTVTITAKPIVSQPPALSGGSTVVVPTEEIAAIQENRRMFLFEPGVSLGEIVRAVNQVGAAPGDLVAILEALKQAGALRAELIII